MENNTLTVNLLNKDTLEDQLAVFMTAFESTQSVENVRKWWKQKHYSNPHRESFVFGVFDGNRLVSINAYMPMKYKHGDTIVNVLQSCESGTIPEYRGKGIWSKDVKYAVEYFKNEKSFDFLIGFPNYRNSYGGFLKMGWNHTSEVSNYIMIGNGRSFFKAITGVNLPIGKLFELQRTMLNLHQTNRFIIKEGINDRSSVTPIFDDGFHLVIDNAFVDWKNSYKSTKSFTVWKEEKLLAECFYNIGNYKGAKIANLISIYKYSDEKKAHDVYCSCFKQIIKENKEIAFIRTWAMPDSRNERIIKHYFLKSKHRNPFITYTLKEDVVNHQIISDSTKWQELTFMDLD